MVIGRLRFLPYGEAQEAAVFSEQLTTAIEAARSFSQVNQLSAAIWKSHAAGLLDDTAAQTAAEALQSRKALFGKPTAVKYQQRISGPRKPFKRRSPDKQQSIERRRRVALSGAVPSRLAAGFTISEMAALSVVASEVKVHGSCSLPIDAIAARAGCGRTSVQNALRQAARLGLVHVRERRRPGLKNLTNKITIISAEWRAWLRLTPDRVQKREHHGKYNNSLDKNLAVSRGASQVSSSITLLGVASHGKHKCAGP